MEGLFRQSVHCLVDQRLQFQFFAAVHVARCSIVTVLGSVLGEPVGVAQCSNRGRVRGAVKETLDRLVECDVIWVSFVVVALNVVFQDVVQVVPENSGSLYADRMPRRAFSTPCWAKKPTGIPAQSGLSPSCLPYFFLFLLTSNKMNPDARMNNAIWLAAGGTSCPARAGPNSASAPRTSSPFPRSARPFLGFLPADAALLSPRLALSFFR